MRDRARGSSPVRDRVRDSSPARARGKDSSQERARGRVKDSSPARGKDSSLERARVRDSSPARSRGKDSNLVSGKVRGNNPVRGKLELPAPARSGGPARTELENLTAKVAVRRRPPNREEVRRAEMAPVRAAVETRPDRPATSRHREAQTSRSHLMMGAPTRRRPTMGPPQQESLPAPAKGHERVG